MGNLFRNTARFYDLDNRDNLTADIPFYLDYAGKCVGEVLELGCGTGRVALMLAESGYSVTGLDLSNQMLDIFREKLASQDDCVRGRVSIVHGNMADFRLRKQFGMIIAPFRVFQALTDDNDIDNALSLIREHLSTDGVFIINVFRPNETIGENWCFPETIQWERHDEISGCHVVKTHWGDRIDLENQIIYPHFAYEVRRPDGSVERTTDDLALKYYYQEQLADRLGSAGFVVTEGYGWYDKSSIEEGRELILVCKRKEESLP